MFELNFDERLYRKLEEVEDPFDIVSVVEKVGDVLHEISVVCSKVKDVNNCWDELSVTLLDNGQGAFIEAYIHVETDVWTDSIKRAMFTILRDGFTFVTEKNAFRYQLSVP